MQRETFENELQELQDKIKDLTEFTVKALNRAMEALETKNVELALEIMEDDEQADSLDEEINEFVVWLIAKQQPVARDLRKIIGTLKMASDIERIADFAVNIAKATIRIGDKGHLVPIRMLHEMKSYTIQMLEEAITAFYKEDSKKARKVSEIDDKIDDLYGEFMAHIQEQLVKHPEDMVTVTQLALVCRYLERAGDHVTNIAETAMFVVKGRHYTLNE